MMGFDPGPAAWMAGGLLAIFAVDRLRDSPRVADEATSLIRDEDGAAYTLAYVLTLPFYLILVCLIIESGLVMLVKLGTVNAAYAAARAAIVWGPAQPGLGQEKARLAAVQAMVPFAGSENVAPGSSTYEASRYYKAYKRYSAGPAPSAYLMAKYRTAARLTRVKTRRLDARPDGLLEARVTYEMPLHVPVVARMLGSPASWGGGLYSRKITTSATLPNEAPMNATQTLGIDYRSD